MYVNYFIVNGVKYYTGTVFIVKHIGEKEKATFICYDTDRKRYIYKVKDCQAHVTKTMFEKQFVCITNEISHEVHLPTTKTKKDTEIDGLFLGWIWYIFLMAVATIFKGNIGFWILFSVVFFNWRSKKIKEEGTYIEW